MINLFNFGDSIWWWNIPATYIGIRSGYEVPIMLVHLINEIGWPVTMLEETEDVTYKNLKNRAYAGGFLTNLYWVPLDDHIRRRDV